jgi:hypothetical protein
MLRTRGLRSCAAVLSAAVLALSCNEAENQARSEAGALNRAIDGVRNADNAAKGSALGALRSAKCSHPDVCRVRSGCLRAYELHVSAVANAAEAQKHLDAGSPERAAAALVNAERDLKKSGELAQQCADLQGELVRKFRL